MHPNLKTLTRHLVPTTIVVLSSCVLGCAPETTKEWVSLFDGTDLSNWTVKSHPDDAHRNAWTVSDGAVLGETTNTDHGKIWLYSNDVYGNFQLRLKYQVEENNACNSGIVLRGLWNEEGHFLNGPQVDISSRGMDGAIYDETSGSHKWLKKGQTDQHTNWAPAWNEMLIEFNELQLRVWINDALVTDFDGTGWFDDANHKEKQVACVPGHIALQIHNNDKMRVRYKDIEILEL
ncbi:3-keto-disaccharide hydrolase [Pelagicoccus mobilis]|uniref:DUF1080 domain-containing protein n=1 Tax=Pelagicoccus mobilis TaxID=415221 RepID=A0A934RV54_9BACT|nr:DUF1080 domain-containing protein [Pelagicoccus mobilis]MBK1878245.1 DUF1080 domain-containing protein [Pelagicoccus mobilis]